MGVNAKSGGSWVTATPSGKVGGSWAAVQTIYEKISGSWSSIWTAMTVSMDPGDITTATESAVVSGGTSPYTYAWAWAAVDDNISIDNPSSSSTTLTKSGGREATGTLQLTVTDNNGIIISLQASIDFT